MKRNANSSASISPKGKVRGFNQVLQELMNKNVKTGIITLDKFRRATGETVEDCVNFLKTVSKGDYVAGRRGHPSRFVFGDTFNKWVHQEAIRAEWRVRNGRDPVTGTPIHKHRGPGRPVGTTKKPLDSQKMTLQVTVGNQKTDIPLNVALVPA